MLIQNPPARLTDQLWMLGTTAYPLYFFRGEHEGAIFEGGTSAICPLLAEQIEHLGVGSDFVKQVIVTHAHPDHVMAVPLLREMFPGVAVLASPQAAQTLASEKAVSLFCQVDEALTAALLKAGAIAAEHRREPPAQKHIPVDRLIREGDTIQVEQTAFQVLETPGHSDCSLSFYEPVARILLVSDATGYYLPEHDYWWPNYFAGYAAYLGSMRRLAELDVEVLCLSHNAAVRRAADVQSYLRRAIAATEQYHQRIVEEARSGKAVREIAEQLGMEVYEKTQLLPPDFFQKNCGLLVKLSLRHEGISMDK